MSNWPKLSRALCEQITRNVHDYFDLRDSDLVVDPLTEEGETVGGLLAELVRQLTQLEEPPFTYQRLAEMAELSPDEKKQYGPNHGTAYLRAVLQLSAVTIPSEVFDDFDSLLDQKMPDEIKLEPIKWAFMDIPGPQSLVTKLPMPKQKLRTEPELEGESELEAQRESEAEAEAEAELYLGPERESEPEPEPVRESEPEPETACKPDIEDKTDLEDSRMAHSGFAGEHEES